MLITLIPQTAGYDSVTLDGTFLTSQGAKRANRVKLLNGGTWPHNEGFDNTDRTFNIVAEIKSEEQSEALRTLFVNDIDLLVEDETALNEVLFYSFFMNQGVASIVLWVTGIATSKADITYPGPYVPPGYWLEIMHDSYWTSPYYNGVSYEPVVGGMTVIAPWSNYYTPSNIRITFTGTVTYLNIYAKTYAPEIISLVDEIANPVSGQSYSVNYAGRDEINQIQIGTPLSDVDLTRIEFWKEGDEPATKTWTDFTDDAHWLAWAGSMVWDGAKWVVTTGAAVDAIGTWMDSLRPSKVRITISSSSNVINFILKTSASAEICRGDDYTSLGEMQVSQSFTLDSIGDIDGFTISSTPAETFNIDKIEMLV